MKNSYFAGKGCSNYNVPSAFLASIAFFPDGVVCIDEVVCIASKSFVSSISWATLPATANSRGKIDNSGLLLSLGEIGKSRYLKEEEKGKSGKPKRLKIILIVNNTTKRNHSFSSSLRLTLIVWEGVAS